MSKINQPQIYYGEVIDINSDTYELTNTESNSNINTLFTVKVLIKENGNTRPIEAKPADNNIKRIPIIGEVLVVIQLFNHKTSVDDRGYQWYYLNPIGIKSSINNNILAVNSTEFKPDSKFVESNVPLLQPYRGDLLIEGRYGNSIRFSNTVDTANSKYTNPPSWSSNSLATSNNPSPIIILSNGRKIDSVKSFTVENIQTDAASLYLTSTQKIPGLLLGNTNDRNSLSCFTPAESQYANSQFIGTADRVILKAKTDVAIIDSPTAIILNTTGDVKIGSDTATESMVHGDVLLNILQKILNQLSSPIQCGSMTGTFLDKSNSVSAQKLLQELLSSTYFINKNTY